MAFERLTEQAAQLGEGPCWHQDEQALYWVDILGKRLHRFTPAGTARHQHWDLPELVGTVAPQRSCAGGGLLLALQNDVVKFDPATGKCAPFVTVDTDPRTRLNDGKCDPQGRFWVGSMDLEEKESIGSLYSVERDGTVKQWADGIGVSNGMTWSPDEREMFYIDSPTRCVYVYTMDPESGVISDRRVLVEFDESEGFPDGMTSDADGNLWIAHWGGARVTKRHPKTGEVLASYPTEAYQTSACCFGGPDLRELYVTSAAVNLTETQKEEFSDSGHLLKRRLEEKGTPTHAFG